ncbi:NAD-dependent epimerase/dehydratase family protein [Microbacterium hydrocarbonoxydans]|uniref:NAD-dependent epimerase/dehydratase family protein n=1 Tax=Microbacterium hydrocarbonoxydans TaxID=273678 RepID=UPI0007BB2D35|nr:NAD-dependent epimerase/dehydratase family protein [Microbacterium hydrocarbonoxydans]GAT71622.1 epimerase/dehydratase [Microbacterium sp. HM58-2]
MSGLLLVTGGSGFIGSAVVSEALATGWRVRVLDSLRADVHGHGQELLAGVEFIRADVRDPDALRDALSGADAVCHQAAKVGLGVGIRDAPDYVSSNSLGTAVLLAAMADAGIGRLVLASSMVVYGEGLYLDGDRVLQAPARTRADLEAGLFEPMSPRTGEPLTSVPIGEDAPCDPRNVYAATKLEQELLARTWAQGGGRVAMLRYHNVYGPGMPQGTPYAGVASLFRSALERGEGPRVFEDGRQRRDFIHVRDVARANIAALDWTLAADATAARAFNVATGEPRTIGEFADALARAFGAPEPERTGEFRMGDVRHIVASADRIRAELGWRAEVSFEEGVREFAHAPLRPAVVR